MYRTPMLVYGICMPVGPSRFDLGAVGSAQTTLTGWGFFMHLLEGGMPKRAGRSCQRSTTREISATEILRYIIKTKILVPTHIEGFKSENNVFSRKGNLKLISQLYFRSYKHPASLFVADSTG